MHESRTLKSIPAACTLLILALLSSSAVRLPRLVLLVPIPQAAAWQDDAFLAAVPAAMVAGGAPMVIAVDPARPWRPELLDFLRRYAPQRVWWVGGEVPGGAPESLPVERLPCASAEQAALVIAKRWWKASRRAVLYPPENRSAALAAAVLAARLGAPLLPCAGAEPTAEVRKELERLGAVERIAVGVGVATAVRATRLAQPEDVVRWMAGHGLPVGYLAATNPNDTTLGPARKLSFAAAILAAARGGAVAPLAYTTVWKQSFATSEEVTIPPEGARPSSVPLRRGAVALGGQRVAFLTGCGPRDRKFWVQLDHNGDGKFTGADEHPLRTGASTEVAGRRFTVDLDADEKARGRSLWLTAPTPDEVRGDLARFRRAAGKPEFLCLVGWPETLPPAVIAHGQGIDADLVSDLPYGQTDPDPFVELAFSRFLAADCASACLLACRGLACEGFRDRPFAKRFATAEWDEPERPALERAGLSYAGHHPGGRDLAPGSPLTEVGLLVHASHAMWTVLGKTYSWNAGALLAPCVVESAGCSTASLDQDRGKHRSVAVRMLRNGAVAFVGNSRRGIAQQELFRSELRNALFAGQTLGQANRTALNRLILAVEEKGQRRGGPFYYQLYNHAVYGDPALRPTFGGASARRGARVVLRGDVATIHAPDRWVRVEYPPNPDWKCPLPKLYTWRGAGTGVESRWHGPGKRNDDELWVTAEVRTRRRVRAVEPVGSPAPIGWSGKFFVDEHADGSRSILWRVRLIDFDVPSGKVRAEVAKVKMRLRG
ncbi:MAG: hypothetical protein H6836_09620 [Planctomycetes bacterium]|nr:hypothetical protein [Planctomycetota bacterium]